jgi:hypothetical protein
MRHRIPGRFVVILGTERLGELVCEQIIANKKGVDAYELTTNQAIS